jgi:hypothetical protein
MESLEAKFRNKVVVAKKCLQFCKGDPEATMAETNEAFIELGQLKRKMEVLKLAVAKLRDQSKEAENISKYINTRVKDCQHIEDNLPKRITNAAPSGDHGPPATKTIVEAGKKSVNNKGSKTVGKTAAPTKPSLPKVKYLTLDDFNQIPKYMKGRWTYDGLNSTIDELNKALDDRYTFLGKGFQAMASAASKKRYKVTICFMLTKVLKTPTKLKLAMPGLHHATKRPTVTMHV